MKLKSLVSVNLLSIVLTAFCLFCVSVTYAQNETTPNTNCRYNSVTENLNRPNEIESTGTSGTGANIDVLYHKIFWRINPDSTVKYIKGSVQTNFKTIASNVSIISFDLRNGFVIDSIKFRNLLLPVGNITHVSNIVTINLGTTLSNNFIDSLVIYYQGVPPSVVGAAQGYQRGVSSTAGNYITTLSESYEDRDWWPCKHDMQDKIDSMDVTVSVPWGAPTIADTFWVACNGKMIDSSINGNSRFFTFKTRYPIATYLVFVSVAKYDRHYRSANANGTNVPVVYNLLRGKPAATTANILTAMDRMNLVLQVFSSKMGDYPFKNEKHGYYDGLLGAGGMEHQTFSGMATGALASTGTLVHELMHQWFGDNVTFATWNDLWLAEGFANYGEALGAELVPSLGQNAFSIRNSIKNSALASTVSAWIPNSNSTTSNLIWNSPYGGAVYSRGGMIVSMLRAIAGDTKFFEALTNYQTNLAGKTATTDSLRNYFNAVLGRDISVFFNDYVGGSGSSATLVGGKGNPVNTINWNTPLANKLVVQVASQTQSANSNVTYYRGPVVLHIKGALPAQDTTISFFDWGSGNLSYAGNGLGAPISGNLLSYDLSFTPTTVFYDDSARTLTTGTTVLVPGLGAAGFTFNSTTAANANCIAPTSMAVALSSNAVNGFANPITISATGGVPAGTNITFSSNPIVPGTSTIATLSNTNLLAQGTYIINLLGTATGANNQTATVSFTINPGISPAITTQPMSQTVCEGSNVTFGIASASATNFQWQISTNAGVSWANISAATNSTLLLPAVSNTVNGNLYRCQASTICGATLSSTASLAVNSNLAITTQPANASICSLQSNTFCVAATGSNLAYQWQSSTSCVGPWTNIATATNNCLTISNATATLSYRCVISSSTCTSNITSNCVTLIVNSRVSISAQPSDVEVCSGSSANFATASSGSQTIIYQWQVSTDAGATFNNIAGANNANYTIVNTTASLNNNRYRCLLSSTACATPTISNASKLTVRALPAIALSAAPFTTLLPNQTSTLTLNTNSTNGGVLSTNWFYNAAPINFVGNNYLVNINQAGSYYTTVKETYTSGLQCSNTSATVVIAAAESNKLFIFPTPNNGTFNVSYYNSSNTITKQSINIYDAKGALVYKKDFTVSGFYTLLPIKMQAVSKGIYFVVIYDVANKKLAEGKVQIK
jgi:hypothetical protein